MNETAGRPLLRAGILSILAASVIFSVVSGSVRISADTNVDPKLTIPDFTLRVLPILTRAGCNSGQCHGAAGGQAGFSLSLRGYDPEADFDAIARERGGRRIDITDADRSLLLKKPSLQLSHRGGRKLAADSGHFDEVREWIAAGAQARNVNDPAPRQLFVEPAATAGRVGEKLQLAASIQLSDGTVRPVSDVTLFSSNNDSVAKVDANGMVEIVGPGETAILVKFLGFVTSARVAAPFAEPYAIEPQTLATNPLDRAVDSKLALMGLRASPPCDDATFLRRASLDLAGAIPSAAGVRAFISDANPNKRAEAVKKLIYSKEAVSRWTRWFADLARVRAETMQPGGARRLNEYIRSKIESQTPLDELVRSLVTSAGDPEAPGAAAFALATESPSSQMEFVTRTFWGVRLACAQCHQHPFDRWSREDYFGIAAFFSRVRRDNGKIVLSTFGEFNDPKTGKPAKPRFPSVPGVSDATFPEIQQNDDRRVAFAAWLLAKDSARFDRVIVNRLWRELTGRGPVEPVDDLRESNPPSNPELLDELAKQFREGGRLLFPMLEKIASTAAYARALEAQPGAERDQRYHSHAVLRPLSAAVLLDAVAAAAGAKLQFPESANATNAQDVFDDDGGSFTLKSFGRCPRDGSIDPAYPPAPGVTTALHWIHGPVASEWLSSENGLVQRILKSKLDVRGAVEEIFLATLSRLPSAGERSAAQKALGQNLTKAGLEDLLWALLATNEFTSNH
ncbi:MAG: DUF1549 domain-containing protein [Planctomycetota bacterium]